MGDMILNLLTTNTVIALVVGAAVTAAVAWLKTSQGQKFKTYEGYAITAVKLAEAAIPDTATNKGMQRLDFALKTFLSKYRSATGVEPDAKTTAQIESWLAVIHDALEESGTL